MTVRQSAHWYGKAAICSADLTCKVPAQRAPARAEKLRCLEAESGSDIHRSCTNNLQNSARFLVLVSLGAGFLDFPWLAGHAISDKSAPGKDPGRRELSQSTSFEKLTEESRYEVGQQKLFLICSWNLQKSTPFAKKSPQ